MLSIQGNPCQTKHLIGKANNENSVEILECVSRPKAYTFMRLLLGPSGS